MRTAASLALVLVAGCSGGGDSASVAAESPSPKPTQLEQAYDTCSASDPGHETLRQPDPSTLVIDTGSESGSRAAFACLLRELETPAAITARMESTNSLMGQQTGEDRAKGLEYTWSYHPDNGVNMVVEDVTDV